MKFTAFDGRKNNQKLEAVEIKMVNNLVLSQKLLSHLSRAVVFSQIQNVLPVTFLRSKLSPERPLASVPRGDCFCNPRIEFEGKQCSLGSNIALSSHICALKMFLCEHFGFFISIPERK